MGAEDKKRFCPECGVEVETILRYNIVQCSNCGYPFDCEPPEAVLEGEDV